MSQASTVDTIGEAEDPLDRADFDAVAYINQQFPTESSLKRLDPFVSRVNSNIAHLDDEISRAVHTQAEVRSFIGLCCLSEFSSVCSGDYFPLPPTFLEPMPHTPPRVFFFTVALCPLSCFRQPRQVSVLQKTSPKQKLPSTIFTQRSRISRERQSNRSSWSRRFARTSDSS